MTGRLRLIVMLGGLCLVPLLTACDAWLCWLANAEAIPANPNFLGPIGAMASVAARPVYVAVSSDGAYVAVSSYGSDPNRGVLSLVTAGASGAAGVSAIEVGDRPYGLLWLSATRLLVCNEGLAAVGGTAPLQLVILRRNSNDPTDPNYQTRRFGDPNDPNAITAVAPAEIVGPSEAAVVPGTNALVLVTLRFPAGLYLINFTTQTPAWQLLLPADATDPLDEPRGIAVTPDGTQAWICNYGSGANHRGALALAKALIAAKLNLLRGVAPPDANALDGILEDADQWLADHRDPDGQLPYRWPEPDEGPNAQAVTQAEDLTSSLAAFNTDADCADPNDANCPLGPEQWAARDPNGWPTDPDPNAIPRTLVLGDEDDPNHHYSYDTASAVLGRQTEADGEVTVYNLSLQQVATTISVPPRPRSARITPDGSLAVVTCAGHDGQTGSVVIISTDALAVTAQRDLPFVPALVRIDPLGARAYIGAWTGDQMAVINLQGLCDALPDPADTRFYTVFDRPAGIDTSSDPDLLWGASFGLDQVSALDVFEGVIRIP